MDFHMLKLFEMLMKQEKQTRGGTPANTGEPRATAKVHVEKQPCGDLGADGRSEKRGAAQP